MKPDVVASTCVSVTGSGGFPRTFCGTSAAAPHVAGIAARDNLLGVRGVAPRATIYGFDLTIGSKTIDENDKARAAALQRAGHRGIQQ